MNAYTACGIRLSSDLPLPEFQALKTDLEGCPEIDVVIQEGRHQDWPSFKPGPHSTSALAMGPGEWRLELEGVGWFRAWKGERVEWERWDDSVSDRDLRTFLTTSCLGALLIQRGALVLSATTLSRDGKALMLLGCPVAGKSTLAWCLLQQGWQLLSSELSVVDENGDVWPGLQQLKLWHNSAVALNLDWPHLPVVRHGLKRYSLLPPRLPVAGLAAPLDLIYTLGTRDDDSPSAKEFDPERQAEQSAHCTTYALTSQRDALLRVRNQAFHPRFYRAMECENQLFAQASTLVRNIPGYLLRVPEGIKKMQEALESVDLLQPKTISAEPHNDMERTSNP